MAPRIDSRCLFPHWPPVVSSIEELDQVLSELARVARVEAQSAAAVDAKITALKNEAAADLVVHLTGSRGQEHMVIFADWKMGLETAAEGFAKDWRPQLLLDGQKSRDLNHGTFGWRQSPAGLDALEGMPPAGDNTILKKILTALRAALVRLASFAVGGERFIDVKLSWRKKELLTAFQDGFITRATLKKTGFQLREATDVFFLKPDVDKVESLPQESVSGQ
ncbi:MAG TPA: hypothetical protein VGH74_15555 [Planctomycetaceae bacterium]|jgi:hypothetical protein